MRFAWVWQWILDIAVHLVPYLLRRHPPAVVKGAILDDDSILAIAELLDFQHCLQLSLVSRRLRILLMPTIFGRRTWEPVPDGDPFPPSFLWPHIRVFRLRGFGPYAPFTAEDRSVIVSHLRNALPHMAATHTFVLMDVCGGCWPQLLDIICTAPRISRLVLDSDWDPSERNLFDTSPTTRISPLRSVAYNIPFVSDPLDRFCKGIRRPKHRIEVEAQNMHSIMRACCPTLESLSIPGEIFLGAVDVSLMWCALQKLHLEGFWPDPGQTSLLSILRAMPNLRILRLKLGRYESDRAAEHIVPPDNAQSLDPENFLPHLVEFEAASLSPGERVLSVLPIGLERLSLPRYPFFPMHSFRDEVMPASAAHDILAQAHFPNLRSLELWYRMDAPDQLPADERLLASLPRSFPLLRHLTVHRFVWYRASLQHWDPVPIFRTVLPQFPHLESFTFDPDIPERAGRPPMLRPDAEFVRLQTRLYGMAGQIASAIPWLRQISMYRPLEFASTWEHWSVVAVPGEELRLHPPPPDASLYDNVGN